MKVLIFNSGIGKRMLQMTAHQPKAMVKLLNGETIFERQIRILHECGLRDFVITTGPFPELFEAIASRYPDCHFDFVHNDRYDQTNYIYSAYLTQRLIHDDFLTLHGDLVFDKQLVLDVLKDPKADLCLINKSKPLPPKDFKGRIIDGELREVGVNIFDENCFAFQPLYKLSQMTIEAWMKSIISFVNAGQTNVYAENAFNVISDQLNIQPKSYEGYYIDEIDCPEDYERVTKDILAFDYKEQPIVQTNEGWKKIPSIIKKLGASRPFFVCDSFILGTPCGAFLKKTFPSASIFSAFSSNPKYEDACSGLEQFRKSGADIIVSIGGGTATDIAKCIKIFAPLTPNDTPYLFQTFSHPAVKHIALPTTAGTGSESTHFAVLYYQGEKHSISHPSVLPDFVMLSPDFILGVPDYQKKCTMLDALCQGIESYWSKNADKISQSYSLIAIKMVCKNIDGYLANDPEACANMQRAANYSGQAINLAQTTAAHALSYKITSIFGIPHGNAVSMMLPSVWEKVASYSENRSLLSNLSLALSVYKNAEPTDGLQTFTRIVSSLGVKTKIDLSNHLEELIRGVNVERLSNTPVTYKEADLRTAYLSIQLKK